MRAKTILLGLSAAALLGLISYNKCKAQGQEDGELRRTPEEEALTIEFTYDTGEFGTNTYVFQQFGRECEMRYLEIKECPNARRNDGTLYGCNGLAYRDFDCEGMVDEMYNYWIGRPISTIERSMMEVLGQAEMIDTIFVESRQEMEEKAGISLEEEVNRWHNSIQ